MINKLKLKSYYHLMYPIGIATGVLVNYRLFNEELKWNLEDYNEEYNEI